MKYSLLLTILFIFGCSKDDKDLNNSSKLKEKWVETQTRLDTLSFQSFDNLDFMNLERGKEVRNGNLVPKFNSGPYEYQLLNEIISLRLVSSSNSNFNDFYFKIDGNRLSIGNFYNSPSGEILIFEKLR